MPEPAYSSGSSTLSRAEVRDSRLNPWNTNPIFLFRIDANWSFDIRDTSWPSRKYWPEVGRSRQPTMCMKVDFPDPDGPVTARNSPRSTSRFTPRNALTSTSPTTYVLMRFLTEMTVGIVVTDPVPGRRHAEAATDCPRPRRWAVYHRS